jgi:hypothetical protein
VKKLIEEHRKRFGEFEVVDFVDTKEIEDLRAETDVAVPLQLNWNWDYGSRVAELRSLYEKGKVNQWNAETDLDWEIPCTNDHAIVGQQGSMLAMLTQMAGKDEATQKAAAFDEINYVLSQLLHGEQAALQLCGQLTNVCHEMDEKWYAASQVIDEARHVEVISKFIERKMGTIYPIGPTLKILLDELLQAGDAHKKTLGSGRRSRSCSTSCCRQGTPTRRRSACSASSRAWRSASSTCCAARARTRSSPRCCGGSSRTRHATRPSGSS